MNNQANTAQIIEEIFALATPAQKSRATRCANAILNGQKLSYWSAEERDAGLYAELFNAAQRQQIIDAAGIY